MKKDGTLFNCVISKMPTDKLHELVPGGGNRKVCIDYNIQVPIIPDLHDTSHGKGVKDKMRMDYKEQELSQEQMYILFCEIMEIDPVKTRRGVREIGHRWYLEEIKDHCLQKLRGFEQ
jgi:hypothetical protein